MLSLSRFVDVRQGEGQPAFRAGLTFFLLIAGHTVLETARDTLFLEKLAPSRLTLEITESVMMTDPEKVIDALNRLRMLGVCISLDDFGTGHSALAYLTRFKWDELKIDRSFVERALSDPMNQMIIRTVKMLARKMNARVTVEGVETQQQRELLCNIGCDTAQGYFVSRPMPAERFREWESASRWHH